MGALLLIITIIGGIASIATILDYKKNHLDKPNDEKEHLEIQFRSTRALSIQLRNDLIAYADLHDTYEENLFPGASIRDYIKLLEESQAGNLSEKYITDIRYLPMSSETIRSMTKSLEDQFAALQQIQGLIKLKSL